MTMLFMRRPWLLGQHFCRGLRLSPNFLKTKGLWTSILGYPRTGNYVSSGTGRGGINTQSTGSKKFKPIQISSTGLECIEYLSLDCSSDAGEWHSDSEIKIDKKGFISLNGKDTKDFWDGSIRSEKEPLRLKIRNICGDESIINLKK